jgi:hypothetical protein
LLQFITWYGTADAIDGRSTFHLQALYITMLPEMGGKHIFADVPLFYEVYETLRSKFYYSYKVCRLTRQTTIILIIAAQSFCGWLTGQSRPSDPTPNPYRLLYAPSNVRMNLEGSRLCLFPACS